MTDTETTLETRNARPALLIAALLLIAAFPAQAVEPTPLDARVVWVRGQHAYMAARDSLTLAPFSRVTFTLKSKPIATGEVERLVDGAMAVARITSGSLDGARHLDRVRVVAEPPRGPRLLRVGYPSGKRTHLLFACESVAIAPPLAYRLDGEGAPYRLIRNGDDLRHARWPDTLIVRTFDDAGDQEIAVERGELDVAVFWPGELSPHMREHPRGKDRLAWPLERALVGEIPEWSSTETRCTTALRAAAAFRALGLSLLRGDLDVSPDGVASCSDTIPPSPAVVRYDVDPSCPGYAMLERFLNRDAPKDRGASITPVVRVSCLDPRLFSIDDAVKATARCQVVCAPQLLPYVRDLGHGVFVTLFNCVAPEREP